MLFLCFNPLNKDESTSLGMEINDFKTYNSTGAPSIFTKFQDFFQFWNLSLQNNQKEYFCNILIFEKSLKRAFI